MAAKAPDGQPIDLKENRRRMAAGELYWAFTPDLIADRRRAIAALRRFNTAEDPTRRELVELWKDVICDNTPLPAQLPDEEQDEAQLEDYPWVDAPFKMDYGYNVKLGKNVYVNSNCIWLDSCTITVGDRTLIGPNCSFYSATHPLDYRVRNGTRGPEAGAPISIGEDCWLGGNVTILPGVTIGKGAVVGAGSVVTKDVPPESVVVGNPARVIKEIDTSQPPVTVSGQAAVLEGEHVTTKV